MWTKGLIVVRTRDQFVGVLQGVKRIAMRKETKMNGVDMFFTNMMIAAADGSGKRVICGDTDSIFVSVRGKTEAECTTVAQFCLLIFLLLSVFPPKWNSCFSLSRRSHLLLYPAVASRRFTSLNKTNLLQLGDFLQPLNRNKYALKITISLDYVDGGYFEVSECISAAPMKILAALKEPNAPVTALSSLSKE